MSAEILRRAAEHIRHDLAFGQEHGDPDVLIPLVDWLEQHANGHDFQLIEQGRATRCPWRRDNCASLVVARAILGED